MTQLPDCLSSRPALQDLIRSLPPEWRVRTAAMLSDSSLRGWLVATADAATVELVANATHATVAKTLGVTVNMVDRRIWRHRQRHQ